MADNAVNKAVNDATASVKADLHKARRGNVPSAPMLREPGRSVVAAAAPAAIGLPPAKVQQPSTAGHTPSTAADVQDMPVLHTLASSSTADTAHMAREIGTTLGASMPKQPLPSAKSQNQDAAQQRAGVMQDSVVVLPTQQAASPAVTPITTDAGQPQGASGFDTFQVKGSANTMQMPPQWESQAAMSESAATDAVVMPVAEPSSPQARPAVSAARRPPAVASLPAPESVPVALQATATPFMGLAQTRTAAPVPAMGPAHTPAGAAASGKADALLAVQPPLPSDSGEDMDIDEEDKRPLPPFASSATFASGRHEPINAAAGHH